MIYVSSSCIHNNKISEIIEIYARAGIKNIELSGGTSYYSGIEEDLIRLKDLYGINYACHAYFPPPKIPFVVNLAACDEEVYRQSVEHYVHCMELMRRIECKSLSVHAGFLIEVQPDKIGKTLDYEIIYEEQKAYDRFCKAYRQLEQLCNENGIMLYLENNVLSPENYKGFQSHNYLMMTDYASIMKMKEQLEFNLLLDIGHLYVSSHTLGLNFEQEFDLLKNDAKWIHLSENNGRKDEHKPLKPNSPIMKAFLAADCRSINITLETAGDINQILASMEQVKRKIKEERI